MPIENLDFSDSETKQFEAMMSGAEAPADPPPSEPPQQPEQPPEQPKAEVQPPAEPPKAAPEPEKPVRLVPHQALHEERELRKALQARLAALERPAPQKAEEPDENQDPLGAIGHLKQRLDEYERREREQAEQAAFLNDLAGKIGSRVQAYAKEHPEYPEQVQFLRESRFRELKFLHPNAPDHAIAAQISQEEIALGQAAINDDQDPGEVISNLAKHRGWQPKAPEKPKAPTGPSEDEKKLDRLARGHKAAVSPSNAGGGGPDPEMTLEKLASLDGAAFDAAFAKHGKRLFGG